MMRTTVAVFLGLAASAAAAPATSTSTISPLSGKTVYFERNGGQFGMHLVAPEALPATTPAVDTHVIFMNKCTGGCAVTSGNTDNRTDRSDIGHGNLSAFSQSATVWNQVMTCMQSTFAQFNVTVTDVDPGTTPHMEVMVAGLGAQIGQPSGVLGIADFPCSSLGNCQSFMSNALVFDFANDSYYTNNPLEICSTAAQEIAHTWALDHVVDPSDPMTYNQYQGMRLYKDNQKCGSDCQGGQAPFFGLTCSGSGGNATHTCALGQSTQNEVSVIKALFGASTGGPPDTTPPTVAITSPANNASVAPGFMVTATVTDTVSVASAELKVDGASAGIKTTAPFSWTTSSTLSQGSHTLVVIGTDGAGNTAMATETVTFGSGCMHDSDCTGSNQVCNAGTCVAGPGAQGGLGSPCTSNGDCASGSCGDDGAGNKYCVSGCNPMANTCPSGFSCQPTSGDQGVCWPGADNSGGGTGGCNSAGNQSAPLFLLGLGAVFLTRRRRS
jgi:MYXO-CTERM domain-containing protein